MVRAEILQKLQEIAAETFGCAPEEFQETTVAADIPKWDSLRHLIFISAIEQRFDVEFDLESISKLTNVGDLVNLLGEMAG